MPAVKDDLLNGMLRVQDSDNASDRIVEMCAADPAFLRIKDSRSGEVGFELADGLAFVVIGLGACRDPARRGDGGGGIARVKGAGRGARRCLGDPPEAVGIADLQLDLGLGAGGEIADMRHASDGGGTGRDLCQVVDQPRRRRAEMGDRQIRGIRGGEEGGDLGG